MADIFTDAGEQLVVDILDPNNGAGKPANWYVAWGTGTGQTAASTTLATEAAESRVAATVTQPSANVLRNVGTITASGTKTISEAGIFSASTSGTMLVYSDFTGVLLNASDSIQFTFDVTFAGA